MTMLLSFSCADNTEPREMPASIFVEVATRGSYQYLIRVNDQLYYPDNLPEKYQDPQFHNLPIYVSFIVLEQTRDIYQPAPNDIPVLAYTVPVINLLSFRE